MPAPRPFALIRTQDQWLRASHDQTALEGEVVQLYWTDETAKSNEDKPYLEPGAGLAFDGYCRLYHSAPEEGRIERLLWAAHDPLQPTSEQPVPVNLFEAGVDAQFGDFALSGDRRTTLSKPRGMAVDEDGRLFIAEAGARLTEEF